MVVQIVAACAGMATGSGKNGIGRCCSIDRSL